MPRKILIVDDEAVNREIMGSILEEDYELIYAEGGTQAIKLIRENSRLLSLVHGFFSQNHAFKR